MNEETVKDTNPELWDALETYELEAFEELYTLDSLDY